MLRPIGLLALLLAAVAVYVLARGGGETSLNPIAQAAARTQSSPGARYSFHGTVQSPSLPPITMTGTGLINGETKRMHIDETVGHAGRGALHLEGVGSEGRVYFRSKAFHRLPSGDEWVGLDMTLGAAGEAPIPAGAGPGAELAQLRSVSDSFETLGKERIRGVETTAYRSTVDLDRLAAHLRSVGAPRAAAKYERLAETVPTTTEVETWIDGNDLIRRMKITAHSHDTRSGVRTVTAMTTDLFDFGISPEIQLPDADTVYDVTSKLETELGVKGSG